MSESSQSLVSNARLLSKVYFPRLIIPASSVVVSLVDFLISFALLSGMMLWYRILPDWRILTLPFLLLLALMTAFGLGLLFSALNVKYRDFRYIVPFVAQMGLYVSPIGFSSSVVPEHLRFLYSLNPMVGVIDGFRWAFLGGSAELYLPGFITSIGLSLALLFAGLWYFHRVERSFADVI